MSKEQKWIIGAGAVMGLLAGVLSLLGNPANMGFCLACFIRDTVGALGLHQAAAVQYARPEVLGLVLGAFSMALYRKEFSPRGGSAPVTRFVLGFLTMIGALVFLGCPFRVILRLAGGDLNAIFGLFGFFAGIAIGVYFLNRGYSLKRTYKQSALEGSGLPFFAVVILFILLFVPNLLAFTAAGKGPGAMHAPLWASLLAGLLVGALAQKSRMCMVGGFRDVLLFRNFHLLSGFIAVFVVALVFNLVTNRFQPGFANQPIAHMDFLWNFLGMTLAGFASTLLGGCPMRQLVLAGEGNSDSVITILGLGAGAAFAHNFGLAASGKGVPLNGKIAVIFGFAVVLAIAIYHSRHEKE